MKERKKEKRTQTGTKDLFSFITNNHLFVKQCASLLQKEPLQY